MSFVGIICENKNENHIKQALGKYIKKENVIIFNQENIENLKNIKFETVAIFSNNNIIFSKDDVIKNIIKKANYLIINADEDINLDLLENMNINVITYGFNSKSTITTSSVNDDRILLCIQRSIRGLDNKKIEPQEISVQRFSSKITTTTIMGVATILLLCGINKIKL